MKKLNKLKLDEQLLNEDELKMLVGGYDISNNNSHSTCSCTYKNNSLSLTNSNSVSGCECTCTSH